VQHSLASLVQNSNFLCESCAEMIAFDLEIIACLKVEPETIAGPEVAGESQCGVRTDGPRAMDYLIDAPGWYADILGQAILRHAQGLEEIGGEDLARMNWCDFALCHAASVIVDDLDVVGVAVLPAEADSPLVIDANAVLSGAVPLELFQAIARWNPKVVELLRGVHSNQFAKHGALELSRVSPDGLPAEQALGVAVGEALDHAG
jgi:hypothetical protein